MAMRGRRRPHHGQPAEQSLVSAGQPLPLVQAAGVDGGFLANRHRILPQVVPPNLLAFCRAEGRDLITVPFAGELAVAFVLDEAERYCYITADAAAEWGADETELMAAALGNLRQISAGLRWKQIGTGARTLFLCETFDGYDASRVLLSRELVELAGRVGGQLVLALPHRDYLIAIGDGDPAFVEEVRALTEEDFLNALYPITSQLFTLDGCRVIPYGHSSNDYQGVN